MGWQTVVAVVFQAGNRIILNPHGLFVYNGAPVNGNLIASVTFASGTDAVGNAYQAGLTSYGQSPYSAASGNLSVSQGSGQVVLTMQPSSSPAPTEIATSPAITTSALFPSTSVERQQMIMASGTEVGGTVSSITMTSESFDLSVGAVIDIVTTFLNLTAPANPSIKFNDIRTVHKNLPSQIQSNTISPGGSAEYNFMTLATWTEGSNFGATFALQSDSFDGTVQANAGITFYNNSINNYVLKATKTNVLIGTSTWPASLTSVLGTQANPTLITTDTWHRVPSFSNSWIGSGSGVNGMIYRLTTDNELEVLYDILNNVNVGTVVVVTFTGIFIPSTAQNSEMWANSANPWAFIDTSGNFTIVHYSVLGKEVAGRFKIALGTLP